MFFFICNKNNKNNKNKTSKTKKNKKYNKNNRYYLSNDDTVDEEIELPKMQFKAINFKNNIGIIGRHW